MDWFMFVEFISLIFCTVTYTIRYYWVHGTTTGFQANQCQGHVDSSHQQQLLSKECYDDSPTKEQTEDQLLPASTIEEISPSSPIEEPEEEVQNDKLPPSSRVEVEQTNQLSNSPCIAEEEPKVNVQLFVQTAEEAKDKLSLSARFEEEPMDSILHSDDGIAEEEANDKLSVSTCIAEGEERINFHFLSVS